MSKKKQIIDIKECKMCRCCGETPLKNLDLYVIDISQALVDHRVIQEFGGLRMMMNGSDVLADMFMSKRDLAEFVSTTRIMLCQKCFIGEDHNLALYWSEKKDLEEEEEKA